MLTRFLLAALILFVGCASADTTPETAVADAQVALGNGDTRAALRILKSGARQGSLPALEILMVGYERGYLQARVGRSDTNIPIFTPPGSHPRWRRAYNRELDLRIEQGDPEALMIKANTLLAATWSDGALVPASTQDAAEGRRILESLASDGVTGSMIQLALLELNQDREAAAAWLNRAAAAGNAQACWLELHMLNNDLFQNAMATSMATIVDRAERCRSLAPEDASIPDFALERVAYYRLVGGSLDSLASLGVFERHPRLAQELE